MTATQQKQEAIIVSGSWHLYSEKYLCIYKPVDRNKFLPELEKDFIIFDIGNITSEKYQIPLYVHKISEIDSKDFGSKVSQQLLELSLELGLYQPMSFDTLLLTFKRLRQDNISLREEQNTAWKDARTRGESFGKQSVAENFVDKDELLNMTLRDFVEKYGNKD